MAPAGLEPRADAPTITNDTLHTPSSESSHNSFDLFNFSSGLTGVDQEGNYLYAKILAYSFLGLSIFVFVLALTKRFIAYQRHVAAIGNPTQQKFWSRNATNWWPWLKKNFIYAPIWKTRHNREVKLSSAVTIGTLPSRAHLVILIAYAACNLAYCLALPYDRKNGASVTAALRGRTGVLAALNLIPTILFALRNNPLINLLEVSYDTFNLLHRWTGRICILEAIVHTIAWIFNSHRAGGWAEVNNALQKPSYGYGMVGTCAFLVISIQAWSPLRHAFYETFLTGHKVLAFIALLGVYFHLKLHDLPQLPWLALAVAFWLYEWIIRWARIIYYNVSRKRITSVRVEALPSEACRVTFNVVRPWRYRPGSHVHVYLPTMSWWTSHPFSVAWSETRSAKPDSEKLPTSEITFDSHDQIHTTISLIIRARAGFTRKLYNKAAATEAGVINTWGFLEGPYSGRASLDSYGTVVLFAGGVGITHQINYIRELLAGVHEGRVATKKIVLVWTCPNTECLEWVRPWMDEILRMPHRREVLKVYLFVTKPRSRNEIFSGTGTVQMFPGRCDVQTVLDKEIVEREGAMAVTVCGPGAFSDDVRAAARKRVTVGCIDFVEEAFSY